MDASFGDPFAGGGNATGGTSDDTTMEQLCRLKAMSMPELMLNATALSVYVQQCAQQQNASSLNNTGNNFSATVDSAKEAAIIAIYCCLSVGCLLGNAVVICVILANKTMRRSITNILIINLAVADFGVGVFSCVQAYMESSLQASSAAYSNSPMLCKFQQVLQVTILAASVCILLIICIDRYLAILYPLMQRQHRKKRLYIVISICCWLFAAFFALPNIFFYNYDTGSQMCQVTSSLKDFFFIYYCVSVALLYAIPFAVMLLAYGRVSARLLSSIGQFGVEFTGGRGGGARRKSYGTAVEMTTTIVTSEPIPPGGCECEGGDGGGGSEEPPKKRQQQPEPQQQQPVEAKKKGGKTSGGQTNPALARRRTVQMFITIVTVFFLCKLPKTVYVLILLTNPAVVAFSQSLDVLVVAVYLIHLLPSAANPVIYFLFSRQYRAGLLNFLTCQLD